MPVREPTGPGRRHRDADCRPDGRSSGAFTRRPGARRARRSERQRPDPAASATPSSSSGQGPVQRPPRGAAVRRWRMPGWGRWAPCSTPPAHLDAGRRAGCGRRRCRAVRRSEWERGPRSHGPVPLGVHGHEGPPPQPVVGDQMGDEPVAPAVGTTTAPTIDGRRSWRAGRSAAGRGRPPPPSVRHRSPPTSPSTGMGRPVRAGLGHHAPEPRRRELTTTPSAGKRQRPRPTARPCGSSLGDRSGRAGVGGASSIGSIRRLATGHHRRGGHHAPEQAARPPPGRPGRSPARAPCRRAGAAGRSAA